MRGLQDLSFNYWSRTIELQRRSSSINISRKAELGRKEACAPERHQQPSLVYEFLKLSYTRNPHSSGDIRRLSVHTEILESLSFRIRDRLALGLDIIDKPLTAASLIWNQDYIIRSP